MRKQPRAPQVSRIQASQVKEDKNAYEFGPFRFEPANDLLRLGDHAIHLPPRARDLLHVLARRAPLELVSIEELRKEVYGNLPVDDTAISKMIGTLRSRLGRREDGEEYVVNVPSKGYRLSVAVRVIEPPAGPEEFQAGNLLRKGFRYLENYSEEGFRVAIESFEQIQVDDPQYVTALLGLAEAYTWSTIFNYDRRPPKVTLEKAKAAARKALELGPASAAALAACGVSSLCYERNWSQALKELKDAADRDPKSAAAHLGLSLWHVTRGENEDAKREIDLAHRIDESSPLTLVIKGFVLFFSHDHVDSAEQFKETVKNTAIGYRVASFDAAYYGLALVKAVEGSLDEASEAVDKAYESSHNVLDEIGKAYVLALDKNANERRRARAELARLHEESKKSYISLYQLATIAAALGDKDQAFNLLEEARDQHDPWIIVVRADPRFLTLHPDPRFKRLLLSLRLP